MLNAVPMEYVSVYRIIMATHMLAVDQNAFQTQNVPKIWHASITNVKIRVHLTLVESRLFVLFTIIFQLVHVQMEQQVMHSSIVLLYKNQLHL